MQGYYYYYYCGLRNTPVAMGVFCVMAFGMTSDVALVLDPVLFMVIRLITVASGCESHVN